MIDIYTIGIFGGTPCDFNIMVMSDFNNLIKVKF